ncbi:related to kinesin light chain 1 [Phialocephala subalpina]|uniref:Related to kinesin light chain 1 n=1 Tax=Phialocephala subalpina TaxID=576137 RepID=A0A1L7XJH3_9HELO|nr:related to kinesin light chain 1 [Phialocephala subalpina]
MRLLELTNRGEFSLTKDLIDDIPPYAILSHTWGKDEEEATFQDLTQSVRKSKAGYKKIQFCAEQAARDGLQHFWVDTCCINKSDYTELSEAINSMFRWYRDANKCYVYLSDVSTRRFDASNPFFQFSWESAFRESRWFTRGWTLQELIAPTSVEFFSSEGQRLGDKKSLELLIHEITGIPAEILQGSPLAQFTIDERMLWAAKRTTKRKEDEVYCLFGIFDIHMPLIYGEGRENAFIRLRNKIDKRSKVPASRKTPLSTVPFNRDLNFIGRQDILMALESKFSSQESHKRVVLAGLGGVGKSQIAIEYSYRLRIYDAQIWVFWVHASTAERFEQGYKSIAAILKLPGWNDPKTDILDAVWRWLSDVQSGRWLLILDNADDIDVFTSTPGKDSERQSRPFLSYIPQPVTGSVLLTTRDRRAASWLSTGYLSAITVDIMTPEDAEQLLETKIPDGLSSASERAELVHELDYLPLAITQAAAYISARATRMPVSKYLTLYRHDEVSQSRLLDEESGDLRRDPGVPNSVIRTWQISFDQIKRKWPSAAELLSFMAMLDRQGIPVFLLSACYPNALDLEAALNPLHEFSLISVEREGASFEMHRLVQLATQKWLEKYQEVERWRGKAVEVVSNAFPNGDYSNWEMCETLWPHAQEVLRSKFALDAYYLAQASLLYHMAWYSWLQGRYVLARAQSQESLDIREQSLECNDIRIFDSVELLGLVLRYQGRYDEAETMNRRALAGTETVLGPKHPNTFMSVNNLALVLQCQGKYDEAETMNRRALAGRETVLGPKHPNTLTSVSNLASILQDQGKYSEAETMNRRVLAEFETALGPEHPNTLTSVSNLASLLEALGNFEDATISYQKALSGYNKVLGPKHPTTIACSKRYSSLLERNSGKSPVALSNFVLDTPHR